MNTNSAVARISFTVTAVTVAPKWQPDFTQPPTGVQLFAEFDTAEEAVAVAELFPKSSKLRAGPLSTRDGYKGFLSGNIALRADATNGGVNETGVKRFRSIMKKAAKVGVELDYATNYGNSFPTLEAALAAIDATVA